MPRRSARVHGTGRAGRGAFDEVLFYYGNAAGNPINLAEIVDNITYDVATAVPEPASIAPLALASSALV